eukprot:938555-Pelagomonas_calceolata.AAC.2
MQPASRVTRVTRGWPTARHSWAAAILQPASTHPVWESSMPLSWGDGVGVPGWDGATPLYVASCCGRTDVVQLLLDAGAAVDSARHATRDFLTLLLAALHQLGYSRGSQLSKGQSRGTACSRVDQMRQLESQEKR